MHLDFSYRFFLIFQDLILYRKMPKLKPWQNGVPWNFWMRKILTDHIQAANEIKMVKFTCATIILNLFQFQIWTPNCFIFCVTDSIFSHTYLQRVVSERTKAGGRGRMLSYAGRSSIEVDASSCPGSPTMSLLTGQQPACPTSVLLLVLHAGSVLGMCTLLVCLYSLQIDH